MRDDDADSSGEDSDEYEYEDVLLLVDVSESAVPAFTTAGSTKLTLSSYTPTSLEIKAGSDTYLGPVNSDALGTTLVLKKLSQAAAAAAASAAAAAAGGGQQQSEDSCCDLELAGFSTSTASLRKLRGSGVGKHAAAASKAAAAGTAGAANGGDAASPASAAEAGAAAAAD